MADSRSATFGFAFDARSVNQAAQSFSGALTAASKNWGAEVKKTFGTAVHLGFHSAMASGKSGAAIQSFVKSNITEVYSKFQRAFHANNMAEAQKHGRALAKIQHGLTRELQAQVAATQTMAQLQARTGAQRANDWKGMLQSIRGGDVGGLVTGGGNRLQTMGRARQDQGRELQHAAKLSGDGAGVDKGASMAKFGKMIATVGKVAMAFAAVAGIVVVLVKMFMDLESRAKDMNKALMASAGAGDFGLSAVEIKGGELTKQLEKIRKETTAVNDNFMKFRAVAAEQQKILSTLNEAGYSYGKMNEQIQKGTKFMKSYSDVTALALTYSRNLGVDSGKIAGDMGAFTLETGQSLDEIAKGFSVIQSEAMMAGFVTKRFYASVIEATSGMAYYGVTIGETAQILSNLDGLMGEVMGPKMLQEFTGKGKDMSAQDRIRELILKDTGFAAEQYGKAFARKKDGIARDLGDTIGKVLGEGETLDDFLSQDETTIRKRLSKFTSGPEIERFTQASVLKRASGGEDMNAMQRGFGMAGTGFDLAMASNATGVFDGKRIDEVFADITAGATSQDAGVAALMQATGKTFEQLEKLNTTFGDAQANISNLQDIAAKDLSERDAADAAFLQRMSDVFGLTIDESTKEIKRGNLTIGNAVDFVASTEEATAAELESALTKDQELATEISSNITGLSEILEQSTNAILERIYDAVMVVVNFMASDDKKRRAEAGLKTAHGRQKKLAAEMGSAQDKVKSARKAVGGANTAEEKKAAEETLIEAEESARKATERFARSQKTTAAQEGLSDAARAGQGLGSAQMMAARGDIGGHRGKTISSMIDRGLVRFGGPEEEEGFSNGVLNAFKGGAMKWGGASGVTEDAKEGLRAEGFFDQVVGGEAGAAEGFKIAEAAFEDAGGGDTMATTFEVQEAVEAYNAAFADWSANNVRSDSEQTESDTKRNKTLEDILEELKQTNLGGLFGKLFSGAKGGDDFILPSGGGPMIIPDEKDTIVGFKPGGPIASGGGGGGGSATVNIYGGDQKKVYDTVMRVMKVLGHA